LNSDDKGQASAEILFISLIVFIVIASFVSITNNAALKTQTGSLGEARMQGEKIVEGINSAYMHGDGYSLNITIPPTPNITAHVNNPANYVTVVYQGQTITIKLMALNVQSTDITSDPLAQSNSIYTITNRNGTINITKR